MTPDSNRTLVWLIWLAALALAPCEAFGQQRRKEEPKKDDRPWLNVKVLIVGVMDDDARRPCTISANEVQAMVLLANKIYSSARIRFAYTGNKSDTIKLRNTVINSLIPDELKAKPPDRVPGALENGAEAGKVANDWASKHPDQMVVFFRYGDSLRGPTGNGFSGSDCGFVAMPGLKATNMGLAGFSHEVGHYLGLAHTFSRSFKSVDEAANYLREHGNDPKIFDGDGLSDTPPDPGLPIPAEDQATALVNLNGIKLELPRGNVMSYYTPLGNRTPWLSPLQQERARQFFHVRFTRNRPPATALRFDKLRILNSVDVEVSSQDMSPWDRSKWANGTQLFCRASRAGANLGFEVPVAEDGDYDVVLYGTRAPDYAIVSASLDGKAFQTPFDGFGVGVMPSGPVALGTVPLSAGNHRLVFDVTGKNAASSNYFFGLDSLELQAKSKAKKGTQ